MRLDGQEVYLGQWMLASTINDELKDLLRDFQALCIHVNSEE